MTTFIFEAAQPSPCKILIIGIFKMQPKLVVVLVLGTTEPLEFSLILKKWPSALNFNCCLFLAEKRAKTAKKIQKVEIGYNFTKWCKKLNSKANSNFFGEFWECTSGIGYLIPSKVSFLKLGNFGRNHQKCPTLGIQKLHFCLNGVTNYICTLPKFPKYIGICS